MCSRCVFLCETTKAEKRVRLCVCATMCVCVSWGCRWDSGGKSHQSCFLLNSDHAELAIYPQDRTPSIRIPRSGHTHAHTHSPLINIPSVNVCLCAQLCVIALLPVRSNYSHRKALEFLVKRTLTQKKHIHTSTTLHLLFILPVVIFKAPLGQRNVCLGAPAVEVCVQVCACMCM